MWAAHIPARYTAVKVNVDKPDSRAWHFSSAGRPEDFFNDFCVWNGLGGAVKTAVKWGQLRECCMLHNQSPSQNPDASALDGLYVCRKQALVTACCIAPLRNGTRRGAQSVRTAFTSNGLCREHRERVPKCALALTSSPRAPSSAEHRVTGALVQTGERGASMLRWTTCMPPHPAARQTSGWPQSGQQWTRVCFHPPPYLPVAEQLPILWSWILGRCCLECDGHTCPFQSLQVCARQRLSLSPRAAATLCDMPSCL